jgi:hypothetical protein
MPAPRRTVTPEQIAERNALCLRAIEAGAITATSKSGFPDTARFELICFGPRGCVHPTTFQPITVEAWVADCRQRGIVPTTPNL